jgi:hypothetical protein
MPVKIDGSMKKNLTAYTSDFDLSIGISIDTNGPVFPEFNA